MIGALRLLCLSLALVVASTVSVAGRARGYAGHCAPEAPACRQIPGASFSGAADTVGAVLAGPGRKLRSVDIEPSVDLLLAARDGDHNAVNRLLASGAADVEFRDGDGFTPLLLAATNGHLPVVRLLIQGGADVNAASIKGFTPLSEASLMGETAVVVVLLEVGANVSQMSAQGFSPLHWAVDRNHLEVVQVLLKNGADMDAQTALKGWTPLNIAAWSGWVDITEELILRGVNVSIADYSGVLPVHVAIHSGEWEPVCEALLDAGADLNAVDNAGDTPLEYAAWTGNFGAVKWLLEHGAEESREIKDAKGKRPWQEVCGCMEGGLYTIPCFPGACQDHEENNELRVLLGGQPLDLEVPGAECQGLPRSDRLKCLKRLQKKRKKEGLTG